MNKILTFAACLTVVALLHAQSPIYVTPNGVGNGDSWSNACNLETAVKNATFGKEIWIQTGTHYPSKTLIVPASVKLYGGFFGTETALSQRDFVVNPTIVDGQREVGSVFRLENAAEINGLTIQNGNANGNSQKNGGGVWANENAVIENCVIMNNTAVLNGGGIYANGEIKIVNTSVENNTATGNGKNMFGNCLILASDRKKANAEQIPPSTTTCNTHTPGWGDHLGIVSFRTSTTWKVGTQTWSDVVMATNCNKTSYLIGSENNYNADCRNNNSYGHLYSWCAVERFAHQLCPAPWRVPTAGDFFKLDLALGCGIPGNTRYGDYTILSKYMGSQWGGTYDHGCSPDGSLSTAYNHAHYWSQTKTGDASLILRINTAGDIGPQWIPWPFGWGYTIRCVRYDL